MKQKWIAVIGSSRRGMNTETIVDYIIEGLNEHNIQVEKYFLNSSNISTCSGCELCFANLRSNQAVFNDAILALGKDAIHELRAKGQSYTKISELERIAMLDEQKSEKQHKRIVLDIFIKNLTAKKHALDSFNNKIWMATIDRVLLSKTGQLTFRFKDGTEICTS